MPEVIIYKSKNGNIELEINLSEETVWLSLCQLAKLFGRDKSVISRHLANLFKCKELNKASVVAKFATTASDGKIYQIDCYNLDVVIALGYRVSSEESMHFRQWATRILKEYLVNGYTLNEKRLFEIDTEDIRNSLCSMQQKRLVKDKSTSDLDAKTMQLILSYSKTWHLLAAYDEDRLNLPQISNYLTSSKLNYSYAKTAINTLKLDLIAKSEATHFFGNERDKAFQSILSNIEQTFENEPLYKTVEEKAAHLLYFIIKDRPFIDGNKRIGCFIFLLYLKLQNINAKLNKNGLVALALLIAESNSCNKKLMIHLIVNILVDL